MDLDRPLPSPADEREDQIGEYCRQIETYLCRKNEGHLIRIVGPAFEQVCSWARRGVPLKIAFRGIDRCVERYYAKGPRRRPVRIEFCEADVLDVFDDWRRAVGVPAGGAANGVEADRAHPDPLDPPDAVGRGGRHGSLAAHLTRAIAGLTALRAGEDRSLDPIIEAAVRELDGATAGARGIRGAAREHLLARLRELDAALLAAARARCDTETMERLAAEADAELAPFRERMTREAYIQSHRASLDRLVRDRARLPVIGFD